MQETLLVINKVISLFMFYILHGWQYSFDFDSVNIYYPDYVIVITNLIKGE